MEHCPLVEQEANRNPIMGYDAVLRGIEYPVTGLSLDCSRGRIFLEVAVTPQLVERRFHLDEAETLELEHADEAESFNLIAKVRPREPLKLTDAVIRAGKAITAFYEAAADIQLA